jgi:hypothetical protein
MMYDGSTRVTGTTSAGPASLELSAPILPKVFVENNGLYAHQGDAYPKTHDEEVQVVRDAAMPYLTLLEQCAQLHLDIVVPSPDASLTAAQFSANNDAIFNCSYDDFGIKPYWIPQLVDDVDICAVVLADGWRMPTQADLDAFTDPARDAYWALACNDVYASADIYVRANDGRLASASILSGDRTVTPLELPPEQWKEHYESSPAVVCVRAGDVIP